MFEKRKPTAWLSSERRTLGACASHKTSARGGGQSLARATASDRGEADSHPTHIIKLQNNKILSLIIDV